MLFKIFLEKMQPYLDFDLGGEIIIINNQHWQLAGPIISKEKAAEMSKHCFTSWVTERVNCHVWGCTDTCAAAA